MGIAQKLVSVQIRVYIFSCFPAISSAPKFYIAVQVCTCTCIHIHAYTCTHIQQILLRIVAPCDSRLARQTDVLSTR